MVEGVCAKQINGEEGWEVIDDELWGKRQGKVFSDCLYFGLLLGQGNREAPGAKDTGHQ